MYYSGIKNCSIENGEGVRLSLFVSGCRNHCKGCFNPETWDFKYGQEFCWQDIDKILDRIGEPFISGISILGGEPFEPENIDVVTMLLYMCKRMYPEKTTWVYTGYTYDTIQSNAAMHFIDVLVDGPYIEQQRDISLAFRGSRNQRIIDVKETLKKGDVVLYEVNSR